MSWASLVIKSQDPNATQMQVVKKPSEKKILSQEERLRLYEGKIVVRDLLKIFNIAENELMYANTNPKMYAEIEMVCEVTLHTEELPIYRNFIRFYPPPSRNGCNSANFLFTFSLEFFKSDSDSFFRISDFEEFVRFIEDTYANKPQRLNYHVMEHRNKAEKLRDAWTCWNKIFKPRFSIVLSKPIIYPPVYRVGDHEV